MPSLVFIICQCGTLYVQNPNKGVKKSKVAPQGLKNTLLSGLGLGASGVSTVSTTSSMASSSSMVSSASSVVSAASSASVVEAEEK